MAQDSVEKFLGRLVTDDDFRDLAKRSIVKASVEHGYIFTAAEQKILQSLDFDSFIHLANNIDRGIKRFGNGGMKKGG
ncbi:MAG: hypothetical protein HY279_06915 [Nitrospinae bacterium]|nr:hypothetical protein [Nitrospinota bacterium]